MPGADKSPLSYADAGVDIRRGADLVNRIKSSARDTGRDGVIGGLGGFGGLFDLARTGYSDPLLVSATDGVGTKLMLAIEYNQHATIGIDLVAMCVNDIIVQGAEPLFFLDYFATGKLDLDTAETVINGIAAGCSESGAALLGGETAEMPGMYPDGHYDLAGFCVGVVEREHLLDGSAVEAGDAIIGLASDGVHANGYSLVRAVLAREQAATEIMLDGRPLAELLLAPTRIYVRPLRTLIAAQPVHALAHITGGGLTENLPRVLPRGLAADIDLDTWTLPPVFSWLRERGPVSDSDMLETFNCGIGMMVIVPAAAVDETLGVLADLGERATRIGTVTANGSGVTYHGTL